MTSPATTPVPPFADENVSREQRRARSEAAILDAARELFASAGFERTTIRAVAAKAGVDPALVMHYYVNKEGLFAASARWKVERSTMTAADKQMLAQAALNDLFATFEVEADREAAIALMRACLTHPTAARIMRDDVMCDQGAAIGNALDGEDVDLRAGLLGACMMGLAMARYVLEIDPVAGASREDLERLMKPVLDALVRPEG